MPKKSEAPVEEAETEEPSTEAETPDAGAGPDPEEFLSQIEARAHKGASEGFKTALDEWTKKQPKPPIEEPNGETTGARRGSAGSAGPGGGTQRPVGERPSSVVRDAIGLLVGKSR